MTVLKTYEMIDFNVEIVSLPCATVEFIDGIQDPFRTMTMLARGYKGKYTTDDVTDEEITQAIKDMNNTKLETPVEVLETVWLLKGVTRAFTHQLVRTRVGASFVQESMRFLGHSGTYRVLALGDVARNDELLRVYARGCFEGICAYENLLELGVNSEDARGALPTNILTSVFVGYSMTTLRKVYTQRMCCQAQPGEWQHILRQMKNQLILQYGEKARDLLSAPYERGEPCGYRASFDRPCTWQSKS